MPRGGLKLIREQVREQLTSGERVVYYGFVASIFVLPLAAVGVLVYGGSSMRGLGIGLLFATLVVYAVPVAPIMKARVRRRRQRAGESE